MSEVSSSKAQPVAVDAMGGDLGPRVVVEGALRAAEQLNIPSILVGKEAEIKSALDGLGGNSNPLITFQPASEVITMEDSPSVVLRGKPDASIKVAFNLVRDGKACGVVSPGNTGAMMAAGIAICGILPGVVRPAISSLIPRPGNLKPTVLVDSGANIDCHAAQLVQFALMGSYYAVAALGTEKPRVALLSNGSEPSKGTDITRSAARILSELPAINFIGYVEGRDLSRDVADVVACDGFVGNVVLKTVEGTAELVFDSIRVSVEDSLRGKIGMWLAKPLLKALIREKLDPSSYGGAPLLGLNGIGVVCHGSANAWAIQNAVRAAWRFREQRLVERISDALTQLDLGEVGGVEDGVWNRVSQRFERRRKRDAAESSRAQAARAESENE